MAQAQEKMQHQIRPEKTLGLHLTIPGTNSLQQSKINKIKNNKRETLDKRENLISKMSTFQQKITRHTKQESVAYSKKKRKSTERPGGRLIGQRL